MVRGQRLIVAVDWHVYVAQSNNGGATYMYSLNASDGTLYWSQPFSSQWEHYWAPAVVGGRIYADGAVGRIEMHVGAVVAAPDQAWAAAACAAEADAERVATAPSGRGEEAEREDSCAVGHACTRAMLSHHTTAAMRYSSWCSATRIRGAALGR